MRANTTVIGDGGSTLVEGYGGLIEGWGGLGAEGHGGLK